MTPMRASMVGPPDSATSNRASIAACHSGASCSASGSLVMYSPASCSVTSWRPRGSGIGSSNGRFQPEVDFVIILVLRCRLTPEFFNSSGQLEYVSQKHFSEKAQRLGIPFTELLRIVERGIAINSDMVCP
jgi:hypothetical protein